MRKKRCRFACFRNFLSGIILVYGLFWLSWFVIALTSPLVVSFFLICIIVNIYLVLVRNDVLIRLIVCLFVV